MIFNGIKRRWLRKEINKLNKKRERLTIKWPQSLVVIYDSQQVSNLAPFYEWARELGVKKEAVSLVAFVNDKKKSTLTDVHLVDDKLIKWSGGVADKEIADLLSQPFDLQVNFYKGRNHVLEYVSQAMFSGLKVAYGNEDESLYDLSIGVDLNDHQVFIKELKKYLKILTQ